jgi:hypothetical protein
MDITVHHVELSILAGRQVYVSTVEMPRPEGAELPNIIVRITPADTFESLAAEYQIDPDSPGGWDDLLELLFYGRTLGASAEDELADPDGLFNAPTVEHARKAKLAKIRKHRGKGRLRGAPGRSEHRGILGNALGLEHSAEEDPLEFIKRTAPMSREHIKIKAAYTHHQRNQVRARRAGANNARQMLTEEQQADGRRDMKLWRRESPEELRERLFGPEPTERLMPPPAI